MPLLPFHFSGGLLNDHLQLEANAPQRARAFTLIELLAVIVIAIVLLALALPAIASLNTAGNMNGAVNGISLLLNQCRAYAMSRNTYVWVGFYPDTATQKLKVGVVAGKTGQVDDLTASSGYVPIYKVQAFEHLTIKDIQGLTGMAAGADSVTSSTLGTFRVFGGGSTITFTEILQFDPAGEARVKSNAATAHWIQIGLQPVLGTNANNANVAVLQIGTLTGQIQIYRR